MILGARGARAVAATGGVALLICAAAAARAQDLGQMPLRPPPKEQPRAPVLTKPPKLLKTVEPVYPEAPSPSSCRPTSP